MKKIQSQRLERIILKKRWDSRVVLCLIKMWKNMKRSRFNKRAVSEISGRLKRPTHHVIISYLVSDEVELVLIVVLQILNKIRRGQVEIFTKKKRMICIIIRCIDKISNILPSLKRLFYVLLLFWSVLHLSVQVDILTKLI